MDYLGPIHGSPLIPMACVYGYIAILFVILLFNIRMTVLNKNSLMAFSRLFINTMAVFHLILILFLASGAYLYLSPKPTIRVLSPQSDAPLSPETPKIEIMFDYPLQRSAVEKSIYPSVPGSWMFENPVYDTHLYRKLVFYPYFPFSVGKTYTLTVSSVRNFLQHEAPLSYSIAYTTPLSPPSEPVLGTESENEKDERVKIIGSFPTDLWKDLSADTAIRIRFNQEVDHADAESRFSLIPSTPGTFFWEGDTMIFKPDQNLAFHTKYTFFLASGIRSFSGSGQSVDGYAATFTTQEEEYKLQVPSYLQKYSLSCEIAALRMALAYRSIWISEDELLQKVGSDPTVKTGSSWGNPYVGFVGNIHGKQFVNGYGVYWEPIARAANYYRFATSFENWSIPQLTESIQKSNPVVVWISIKGNKPSTWKTPSGDTIYAVPDEHAVIVTGFLGPPVRPTHIIVNDPLTGESYWTSDSFQRRWDAFHNSGVVVF